MESDQLSAANLKTLAKLRSEHATERAALQDSIRRLELSLEAEKDLRDSDNESYKEAVQSLHLRLEEER